MQETTETVGHYRDRDFRDYTEILRDFRDYTEILRNYRDLPQLEELSKYQYFYCGSSG